jgi:SAM-dependent methyltransferase
VSTEESTARPFWDGVHTRDDVVAATRDDPVGGAALAHFGDLAGKRVLDLGCGLGEYSLLFSQQGAAVTAVDTSEVAIARLSAYCERHSIEDVEARVGDAFGIAELGPFDAVFGAMILHHLEPFARFVDVLHDAMAPNGRGFFHENSSVSRLLVWARTHLVGRFGIPKYGDDEEFPLQPQEIDLLRSKFAVDVVYPELFFVRLASGYLLRGKGERACGWVDDRLYRYPRLRRLSYKQYVLLTRAGT